MDRKMGEYNAGKEEYEEYAECNYDTAICTICLESYPLFMMITTMAHFKNLGLSCPGCSSNQIECNLLYNELKTSKKRHYDDSQEQNYFKKLNYDFVCVE